MLKRKAFNKIFITTIVFFLVFSLYTLKGIKIKTEQKNTNKKEISSIYTLNDDNYLSKTTVYVNKQLPLESKIKEKLEIMIKENNKNTLLPSYFNPILPKNTKIEKVEVEDSLVKLYFSKELMDISEKQAENMIEAITYSITDENILGIEIYVDESMLKYVPHTKKEIPTILTKEFGINKVYEISNMDNIEKIEMIYYSESNGKYYETPVTKYINCNKEKLEIILDDLETITNGANILTLMDNVEILDYKISKKDITINLNKDISKKEEEILTKSIFNNYNIDKITILINNQKKIEKNIKTIEK